MKVFDSIDLDGSGELEDGEIEALAEWAWCSFRPGQIISDDAKALEAPRSMSLIKPYFETMSA